jgi:hypothetical protein
MKSKEEIVIQAKAYAKSIGNEDGTSAYDYVMGYNQCQEDMADKKYTEGDMRNCWEKAMDIAHGTDDFPMGNNNFKYPTFEDYINSLNKQD